ncbi:hypothetical protein JOB18_005865 [Solea senegalensis]|uniref:Uncharacterized protein n=1 Tax=Solea senegalensis TaxID=28829 RepID=A0AAV6Q8M4_SOLSE|nr:hypothetical protein JOB18_005865 [Solea senegalensis]
MIEEGDSVPLRGHRAAAASSRTAASAGAITTPTPVAFSHVSSQSLEAAGFIPTKYYTSLLHFLLEAMRVCQIEFPCALNTCPRASLQHMSDDSLDSIIKGSKEGVQFQCIFKYITYQSDAEHVLTDGDYD